MKCKKIRDLILTDYLDGEMDTKAVDEHIASCKKCRDFLDQVRQRTVDPFKNANKDPFSRDSVWARVKAEISNEADAGEHDPGSGFFEKLKGLGLSLRPVAAFSVFIVLVVSVLMFGLSTKQSRLVKTDQSQEQVLAGREEIDVSVTETETELSLAYFFDQGEEYKSYGTSLEQYFL